MSLLPSDVLLEIFNHIVPSNISAVDNSFKVDYAQWQTFFYNQHPNAVAGVCREWRSIALGNPHLWSRWFVKMGTMPSIHPIRCLKRFILRALSRSANAPLKFTLHVRISEAPKFSPDIIRRMVWDVVGTLSNVQARWESVDFLIHDPFSIRGERSLKLYPERLTLIKDICFDVSCGIVLVSPTPLRSATLAGSCRLQFLEIKLVAKDQLNILNYFGEHLEELRITSRVTSRIAPRDVDLLHSSQQWELKNLRRLRFVDPSTSPAAATEIFDEFCARITACSNLKEVVLLGLIDRNFQSMIDLFSRTTPSLISARIVLHYQNLASMDNLFAAFLSLDSVPPADQINVEDFGMQKRISFKIHTDQRRI